jgi:outer membrane protein
MFIRVAGTLAASLALALVLALAGPTGPARAEGLKIGWIDAQKVLDETKGGQDIKTRVEAFRDSRQKLIDTDEDELKKLEEKISEQAAVLSDEARRDKQMEFQRKLADYQKKVVQLNKELQDKRDELLKEFNDALVRAVRKVAEAEGFDYVLDYGGEGSVLYGKPELDLTAKVMAEVDASP